VKIRISFVSNSSSSSFVVNKLLISNLQYAAIMNMEEAAKLLGDSDWEDASGWDVTETDVGGIPIIEGYTSMDNFDVEQFFGSLGLNRDDYVIGSDNYPHNDDLEQARMRWLTPKREEP